MRSSDRAEDRTDMPEISVIRRMRARRRIGISTGDMILFDVAAFRLDRELGVAEQLAVEANIRIVRAWPDVIFDPPATGQI